MIIGCDFHPSWQQMRRLDTETSETGEQKLMHASGEAKRFYQQLVAPVLIGRRATGNSQWFMVVEGRFPRLWTPDRKERDLQQLVLRAYRGAPTIG